MTSNFTADQASVSLLTFMVGAQLCALPIEAVIEVAAMVELISVPDSPPEVLGMMNRRGRVVPMLDLRLIFKQPNVPVTSQSLFIVATHGEQMVGLVVDEIVQVAAISQEALQTAPSTGRFIQGIVNLRDELVQVLALPLILAAFLPDRLSERPAEGQV